MTIEEKEEEVKQTQDQMKLKVTSWYYLKLKDNVKTWLNKLLIQVDYLLLAMID